tara:strand:- start:54 stop:977 length:924 start_codon:yes stop_codon:yes gene_type:complete
METLIEKIIQKRKSFIIKEIFDFLEFVFCKIERFCSLENKTVGFFQIFTTGKLISAYRRKKYIILKKKSNSKIVNELNINSCSYLGKLDKEELEAGRNYFLNQKTIYNSHVPFFFKKGERGSKIETTEFLKNESSSYGSFDIRTSAECPNLKKICKKYKFKEIAEEYLITKKTDVFSINTMLTKSSNSNHDVFNLHRDIESVNSVAFFIYWTTTNEHNGSTSLIPGSHIYNFDKKFGKMYSPNFCLKHLEGEEGSIYALDAWAYHRGNNKLTNPRLATWIRYSSVPSRIYYLDRNYLFKKELSDFNS